MALREPFARRRGWRSPGLRPLRRRDRPTASRSSATSPTKKAELGNRRLPLRAARRVLRWTAAHAGSASAWRCRRPRYCHRIGLVDPAMAALSVAYDLSYVDSLRGDRASRSSPRVQARRADRRPARSAATSRCEPTWWSSAPGPPGSRSPRSWLQRASRAADRGGRTRTTARRRRRPRRRRIGRAVPAGALAASWIRRHVDALDAGDRTARPPARRHRLRRPAVPSRMRLAVRPRRTWQPYYDRAYRSIGLRSDRSPRTDGSARAARRRWPGTAARSWRCSSSLPTTASPRRFDEVADRRRRSTSSCMRTVAGLDARTTAARSCGRAVVVARWRPVLRRPAACSCSPAVGSTTPGCCSPRRARAGCRRRQRARQRRSLLHGPPQCRHRDHRPAGSQRRPPQSFLEQRSAAGDRFQPMLWLGRQVDRQRGNPQRRVLGRGDRSAVPLARGWCCPPRPGGDAWPAAQRVWFAHVLGAVRGSPGLIAYATRRVAPAPSRRVVAMRIMTEQLPNRDSRVQLSHAPRRAWHATRRHRLADLQRRSRCHRRPPGPARPPAGGAGVATLSRSASTAIRTARR